MLQRRELACHHHTPTNPSGWLCMCCTGRHPVSADMAGGVSAEVAAASAAGRGDAELLLLVQAVTLVLAWRERPTSVRPNGVHLKLPPPMKFCV